jgi:hypothetical protein
MQHKIISGFPDVSVVLSFPMSIVVGIDVSVPAWRKEMFYANGQVKRVIVARPVEVHYKKDCILLKPNDVIFFDECGRIDKIQAVNGKTRIINGKECAINGNGSIFLF